MCGRRNASIASRAGIIDSFPSLITSGIPSVKTNPPISAKRELVKLQGTPSSLAIVEER